MFDLRHKIVAFNCLCALAYLVHGGYLGGLIPGVTGPVSVLIVEETDARNDLTAGQLDVLTSHSPGSFLDWIKTHGEHDKAGDYRIVDKDDSMSQDLPKWQTAFAAKGPTVPWLVIERNGRVLTSQAMPGDEGEFMRLVKRYGGQ